MSKLKEVELFAKDKHRNQKYGNEPYHKHLEAVVTRLKGIGITDEDVLCAAWLHDTIEDTGTTFDEIYQRFGRNTAVMVSSLSKDNKLAKSEKERQYIKQLKNAPTEAQLIKLCDISSNLGNLKNSSWSKTRKKKYVNKKMENLKAIKLGISQQRLQYPQVGKIIDAINEILIEYNQKPIVI